MRLVSYSKIREAGLVLLATAIAIALFDLLSWYFAPRGQTVMFEAYRRPPGYGSSHISAGYFVAHPERGFDIKPNSRGAHYLHDYGTYEIWSNELGCFDKEHRGSDLGSGFVYFAGDSFTWGFISYDSHFATRFSERVSTPVLRCGVPNTGQRHQFSKFLDVVRQVGHYPDLLVVNYVANDMADDYSFPTTTILDEKPVPLVELNEVDEVIRLTRSELLRRLEIRGDRLSKSGESARDELLRYSLSANLVRAAIRAISSSSEDASGLNPVSISRTSSSRKHYSKLGGESQVYPWRNKKYSKPNHDALTQWKEHAQKHGYRMIVSLIAFNEIPEFRNYYADMKSDLESEGIEVIDSSHLISELRDPKSVDHATNGHFNELGHRIYADFLETELVRNGVILN